jgi:hypothetical protein
MKPITRLTLAALLTTAVFGTALADTDFGALRHDPMAAIEAGDALGLEVIPRSELEEVRGEGLVFRYTIKPAFLSTLRMMGYSCKSKCQYWLEVADAADSVRSGIDAVPYVYKAGRYAVKTGSSAATNQWGNPNEWMSWYFANMGYFN